MEVVNKEIFNFDNHEAENWINFFDLISDIRTISKQGDTIFAIDLILNGMALFESNTNIKDYY